MQRNIFTLDDSEYQREVDPINQYIEQAANFLSIKTGDSIEACREFVANGLQNKTFPNLRDPTIVYFERMDNGDREKKKSSLSNYIYSAIKDKQIIAPSLTTYMHPSKKESLLVSYVKDNISGRYVAKKAAFKAKAAGQMELYAIKNTEQTNKKLSNNALSGAHVSASTPLFNKTAHATLTSVTRTTSGFGNANNEKIVTGNRHYWMPSIAMNNIVSIVTNSNLDMIAEVVAKYNLKLPTPEEAMACALYSTRLYWSSPEQECAIMELLASLTPVQRAAFVYVGDLYHIRKLNPAVIHDFINAITQKLAIKVDNALDVVKTIPEDYLNLAHQICNSEAKGFGKDYKLMQEKGVLDTIVATGLNITRVLGEYESFIKAFFTTVNVPASVAYLPDSIRRAALTSDTDSTIFTVQEWVEWYQGKIDVTDESIAVAASVVFFASQTITHNLAILSSNFGFARDELHRLAMKNEFRFDVFVPTQVAKHYYALIGCQEGNVFDEYEEEIKGVHLKNSNTPPALMKIATSMMKEIMEYAMLGEMISMNDLLKRISEIEQDITRSLLKGEFTYYRINKIKAPEAYKNAPHQSPYLHHILWEEVFESKYGSIEKPPYAVAKIPTILANPSSMKEWLESIEDEGSKARMMKWAKTYGKKDLPTMYVSTNFLSGNGIPEEIKPIIDTRRIVSDLCSVFYIILETLGYYKKPETLISDFY